MRRTSSYEAAKTRTAIYLTGGLICAGLGFGPSGLMVAAIILLVEAFWEHGEAQVVKTEERERAEYVHRSPSLNRLSPGDLLEDSSGPAGPVEPFIPPASSSR